MLVRHIVVLAVELVGVVEREHQLDEEPGRADGEEGGRHAHGLQQALLVLGQGQLGGDGGHAGHGGDHGEEQDGVLALVLAGGTRPDLG